MTSLPTPAGFDRNGRPIAEGYMGETTFLAKFRPASKGRNVSEEDAEKAARGATLRIHPDLMDAMGNPTWAQIFLDPRMGTLVVNPDYSDRQEVGGVAPAPAPAAATPPKGEREQKDSPAPTAPA